MIRRATRVLGTVVSYAVVEPAGRDPSAVWAALDRADADLRHVHERFHPTDASWVTALRDDDLGERPAELAETVAVCLALRERTGGWFDPWAVPGGFDPSGYVKGWAVDRAAAILQDAGLEHFAINAGGDLLVRGDGPTGDGWRVGVRRPDDRRLDGGRQDRSTDRRLDGGRQDRSTDRRLDGGRQDRLTVATGVALVLRVRDVAVATSGAYERGAHIVDPHTGEPVSGRRSATVVGPKLGVADALATAVFAAGSLDERWLRGGYAGALLDAPPVGASGDAAAKWQLTCTDALDALRAS